MRATLCLFAFFALVWFPGRAQDNPYETVFQRRANRQTSALKGYGAILTEFSPRVNPSSGIQSFLSTGLEGGVLINRRVRVGAFGLFSLAPGDILKANPYAAQDGLSGYLQIGGNLDWLPRSEKPFHVAMGTRLGYGGATLDYVVTQPDTYQTILNNGLLITPHVDVEANLRPWLRVNLGLGYRVAIGSDTPIFEFRRDFSSPVVQFGIQFGNFK